MPEDMDGVNRTHTRVQPIPEDAQGEYLKRALSTPCNTSETLDNSEDTDEDIYEYELVEEVQDQEYEPEVKEEPRAYVPEPEVPISASAMRTSGRGRSLPGPYDSHPQGIAYLCEKGS